MTERRPADVPVHDWQHQKIAESTAALKVAPQRTAPDKRLWRKAHHLLRLRLKGHLRALHDYSSGPFVETAELKELHARLHGTVVVSNTRREVSAWEDKRIAEQLRALAEHPYRGTRESRSAVLSEAADRLER